MGFRQVVSSESRPSGTVMARVAQAEVCAAEIVSIAPAITGERKLDPVPAGRRVPSRPPKNGLSIGHRRLPNYFRSALGWVRRANDQIFSGHR